jgi:DNA-binding MarR family transcriptional regulator
MATNRDLNEIRRLIWVLLHHTYDLILKYEDIKFIAEAGISYQQFQVLLFVDVNKSPVKEKDIARDLQRSPNSVSTLINRMKNGGLVDKERDVQDRRIIYVKLTTKGKEKLALGIKAGWTIVDRLTDSFTRNELNLVFPMIKKLRENTLRELGYESIGNDFEDRNIELLENLFKKTSPKK